MSVLKFLESFKEVDEVLSARVASSTLGEKVPTIHSGSYALDDALSSGGLPEGRIIQYYGAPGSGKTLMCLLAIKQAQRKSKTAAQIFIDAEGTFSPTWSEALGVDTSRVIVIDGDLASNGRRCFEMLLGVPKEDAKTHAYKGQSKEGLLDKIIKKEEDINLIVIDSLGSIIPPGEDTSAVGKMNISLLARFLSTTMKKVSVAVNKAKIPFIVINHKKATMDPYGSDHTYSGGNTYSHFLSANIYYEIVNRADAKILDENDEKIGQTIRARIEKSKFGPWPRVCEFKVDFGIGPIDTHEEVATLALKYKVINKLTSVTYEYKDKKWVGESKMLEALKADEALTNEILEACVNVRETMWEKRREAQKEKEKLLGRSLTEDDLKDSEETSEKTSSEDELIDSLEDKKKTRKRTKDE